MTPAPDVDISPACALSAQAKCAIILCTRIDSAPEYTLHHNLLCTKMYAEPDFNLHQILHCTRFYSAPEYTPHQNIPLPRVICDKSL